MTEARPASYSKLLPEKFSDDCTPYHSTPTTSAIVSRHTLLRLCIIATLFFSVMALILLFRGIQRPNFLRTRHRPALGHVDSAPSELQDSPELLQTWINWGAMPLPPDWKVDYIANVPVLLNKQELNISIAHDLEDWILKLKAEEKDAEPSQILSTFLAALPGQWKDQIQFQGSADGKGLALIIVIRLNISGLEDLLTLGEMHQMIEFVEQDSVVRAVPDLHLEELSSESTDTSPTSVDSFVQAMPPSWGLDRIDQRQAVNESGDMSFSFEPKAGQSIHVYVVDTGIRVTHEDFGGRAVSDLEVLSSGRKRCTHDLKQCAVDLNGHGTHMAGVLGGSKYGVAKSSTIHSVKVFEDNGIGRMSYVLSALDWIIAKAERPALVLLALSSDGQLQSLNYGLETARQAGILVVVASGNDGKPACQDSPAFIPSALVVGSSTRLDGSSEFSNFGSCVDIHAPGSNISTTGISSDASVVLLSSTSLAAAHVVGVAALRLAQDQTQSVEEVERFLISTATTGKLSGLNGSPNRLIYSSGFDPQVPNWGYAGLWSPVDGGVHRACRGNAPDDYNLHSDYEVFEQVSSIDSCKSKCELSTTTIGCAGISYSEGEQRCEVWIRLIEESVRAIGFLCLRHVPSTTTQTTVTTTSLTTTSSMTTTSSTDTTTSVTTTSETLTTTSSTTTSTTLLIDAWTQHPSTNCFIGAGAETAPGADSIGYLPLETCLESCRDYTGCEAVIFQLFSHECWMRSKVHLPHCMYTFGYTLWTNPAFSTTVI